MSRARNIKPGFFKNEDLAECEPMARLLFIGLWTLADRNGNLENRPKRLKGELFPYDNCDPEALLAQLISRGLVVEYEANGMALLNIPTFKTHQNPHMAEKPKYPEPCAGTVPAQGEHGASRADSLLLIPDSGILNPDGSGKKPRPADPLFESLADACGWDWRKGLGKAARGELNAALADLRQMGATPEEVGARASAYRRKFGAEISLTPSALAKHWPSLGSKPVVVRPVDPELAARVAATEAAEARRRAELSAPVSEDAKAKAAAFIADLAERKRMPR